MYCDRVAVTARYHHAKGQIPDARYQRPDTQKTPMGKKPVSSVAFLVFLGYTLGRVVLI